MKSVFLSFDAMSKKWMKVAASLFGIYLLLKWASTYQEELEEYALQEIERGIGEEIPAPLRKEEVMKKIDEMLERALELYLKKWKREMMPEEREEWKRDFLRRLKAFERAIRNLKM